MVSNAGERKSIPDYQSYMLTSQAWLHHILRRATLACIQGQSEPLEPVEGQNL